MIIVLSVHKSTSAPLPGEVPGMRIGQPSPEPESSWNIKHLKLRLVY